jgi:hypothetical protein
MTSSKKPKIIISLMGGLGNQMFQYALYAWLSQKNFNVFLENHWFSFKNLLPHEKYKLDYFNITDIKILNPDELLKYVDFAFMYNIKTILNLNLNFNKIILIKFIIKKIIIKLLRFFHIKYYNNIKFYYENQKKGPDFIYELNATSNIHMYGTFSYYRHIEDIRQILKNSFSFKKELPDNLVILLAEMKKRKTVAIHVRRGDYVGDRIRDVCSMSYFRNAIQLISSKCDDLFFYIFSDDINYIKTNFFFLDNYIIIDNSSLETPDYYDLYLMTQVNHLIISNSTFSWWAAWLNSNPEKIVIVPELYLSDNSWVQSDKLYPPEWIKLAIN